MAKKPVNHPPTPVVESPTDPAAVTDDCEALKVKHGIDVDTYSEHADVKSKANNSHHILQDATVADFIDKAQGLCVLLPNAHSGTAHQITTRRQNNRRDNKRFGRGGTMPGKTFSELKNLSKGDLTESFKQMGIPNQEAEKLAECLVDEAEQQAKKEAKRKRKNLNDSSRVKQTGGCFPATTLIWLNDKERRRVREISARDTIEGLTRSRQVARRDWCTSDVVTLHVGRSLVVLAPFHRVLTASGRFVRADDLRAGAVVRTHSGAAVLARVGRDARPRRIHSIGVAAPFECRVGGPGLWVELPNTGAPVTRSVRLRRFRGYDVARNTLAGAIGSALR